MIYRECVAEKGYRKTTVYLFEKYAELGRVLKLRIQGNTLEDGWVVTELLRILSKEEVAKEFLKQEIDDELSAMFT